MTAGSTAGDNQGIHYVGEFMHIKRYDIFAFEIAQDPSSPGKLKPADVTRYPVSATIELPKSKAQKVELRPSGDHWSIAFDPKGAHRFTVVLAIKQRLDQIGERAA